jgi:8-oxo-dGTP diphosphatase
MTKPRHHQIACAIVIDPLGRFLLQQRDDISGIINPGKVALFGGHCESGETYLQCIVRDMHEELSYLVPPQRFESFLSYDGPTMDNDGGTSSGEFFVIRDIPVEAVSVTEGSLLVVNSGDLPALASKLVPLARHVLNLFQDQNRPVPPISN